MNRTIDEVVLVRSTTQRQTAETAPAGTVVTAGATLMKPVDDGDRDPEREERERGAEAVEELQLRVGAEGAVLALELERAGELVAGDHREGLAGADRDAGAGRADVQRSSPSEPRAGQVVIGDTMIHSALSTQISAVCSCSSGTRLVLSEITRSRALTRPSRLM